MVPLGELAGDALAQRREFVAGVDLLARPNDALRRLVTDGPVDLAPIDEQALAVYWSIVDRYSMHDALLVESHRVRGSDAIVSKDESFDGLETVWY